MRYIQDMEKLKISLMSSEEKEKWRSEVRDRLQKNETLSSISRQTGIHRATLSRWVKYRPVKLGRKKQLDPRTDQDLREKLLTAVFNHRDSIWSTKSIQQFFWDNYKKKISPYHAKKCIYYFLGLPRLDLIQGYFEKPYNWLDGLTPLEYAKLHKLRCNYLLQTYKVFGNKCDKGIHIICSPRGDIRFSISSRPVLFKNLLLNSKNEILLVYFKDILSRSEVLHYSKHFLRITFVCSE